MENFPCKNPPLVRGIIARETERRSADFRSSSSSFSPTPRRFESDPSARQFPPLPPSFSNAQGIRADLRKKKMRSRIITRSHITGEQRSGPHNAISGFEYKTCHGFTGMRRYRSRSRNNDESPRFAFVSQ